MKIGDKNIKEIIITDNENNLLADITDDDLIWHEGVKVELVSYDTNPEKQQ